MKDMKNTNKIIALVVALIVVAAASFYGGLLFGKNTKKSNGQFGSFNAQQGQDLASRRTGSGQNGGFISGQILNIDNSSLIVQLSNNGSKIVLYSDSTSISKMADGTIADLIKDSNVTVTGTTNSDGSITATSIQIRPQPNQQPGEKPQTPPTNQ